MNRILGIAIALLLVLAPQAEAQRGQLYFVVQDGVEVASYGTQDAALTDARARQKANPESTIVVQHRSADLLLVTVVDTVMVADTVLVPSPPDTILQVDTVTVTQTDTLTVTQTDTVFVNLPPDTVVQVDTVTVTQTDTVFVNLPPDTVFVNLPPDTVVQVDTVTVTQTDTVFVTPLEPPGTLAVEVRDSTLTASWAENVEATFYRVRWGPHGGGTWQTADVASTLFSVPVSTDGRVCVASGVAEIQSAGQICANYYMPTRPDRVTDLAVESAAPTSVTLSFTAPDDGLGMPSNFDLRYGPPGFSWGSAYPERSIPIPAPAAIGDTVRVTVEGLTESTAYEFRGITYRGVLNSHARFGPISNAADTTTLAAPSPSPVPDSAVWIAVADDPELGFYWAHGSTITLAVGETRFLCGYLVDEATRPVIPLSKSATQCPDDAVGGESLPVGNFSWCSGNPQVAAFLDPVTGEVIQQSCAELRGEVTNGGRP